MRITIGIVAKNEEKFLPLILQDILEQTYNLKNVELILVDGYSNDSTWELMNSFKEQNENIFYQINLLHNEKIIQSAGWNLVFSNYTTEAVFRIDAHARLDKHFIENSVDKLCKGYFVVGGIRETISIGNTRKDKLLLNVENSLFGCSISDARHNTKPKAVSSVFHAGYLKEVIDKVGFFNESLGRTEDNEYHYRVRKAGYEIYMFNDIISYQYIRTSLSKDIKQKFLNGLWIGKTLFKCPGCLSLFHFIPFCFVGAIFLATALIWLSPYFIIGLMGIYFLFSIINTIIVATTKEKTIVNIFLPFIFLILHLAYGVGTIFGILTFWKKK